MDSSFVNDQDFIPPTTEEETAPFSPLMDEEDADCGSRSCPLCERYNLRRCFALAASIAIAIGVIAGIVSLARKLFRS